MKKRACSKSAGSLRHLVGRAAACFGLGMACLACSSDEPVEEAAARLLSPTFYAGDVSLTRSIVNGIGADPASDDRISRVKMYVTLNSNVSAYPGIAGGTSVYTYDGSVWSGTPAVKLHNEVARIYAFYPVYESDGRTEIPVNGVTGNDTHTIPVAIASTQTFAGTNEWECSVADYMYGSKNSTVGDATPITASNSHGGYSPAIHLQHALAQVVFQLQTKSGRPVDGTYDYVKQIALNTTGSAGFLAGASGRMQLKDGALSNLASVSELVFKPSAEAGAVLCGASNNPVVVAYGLVAPLGVPPSNVSLTILLGKPGDTAHDRQLAVTGNAALNVAWAKGKKYVYNLILDDRILDLKEAGIKGWEEVAGSGTIHPDGY